MTTMNEYEYQHHLAMMRMKHDLEIAKLKIQSNNIFNIQIKDEGEEIETTYLSIEQLQQQSTGEIEKSNRLFVENAFDSVKSVGNKNIFRQIPF